MTTFTWRSWFNHAGHKTIAYTDSQCKNKNLTKNDQVVLRMCRRVKVGVSVGSGSVGGVSSRRFHCNIAIRSCGPPYHCALPAPHQTPSTRHYVVNLPQLCLISELACRGLKGGDSARGGDRTGIGEERDGTSSALTLNRVRKLLQVVYS